MKTQEVGEIFEDFSPLPFADDTRQSGVETDDSLDVAFSPKGAFAFFALMMALYGIMWFSLYFELLSRR